MKKVMKRIMGLILICGLILSSNSVVFAGSPPIPSVTLPTVKSGVPLLTQLSTDVTLTSYSLIEGPPDGVRGYFNFIPKESGKYKITIEAQTDYYGLVELDFFLERDLFPIREATTTFLVEVVAGETYACYIGGSPSNNPELNITFDRPLMSELPEVPDPPKVDYGIQMDDITIVKEGQKLGTSLHANTTPVGQGVVFTFPDNLSEYAEYFEDDKWLTLNQYVRSGTYSVTAALKDHPEITTTFDIIIKGPDLTRYSFSPIEDVVVIKQKETFLVPIPTINVVDDDKNSVIGTMEGVEGYSVLLMTDLKGDKYEIVFDIRACESVIEYFTAYDHTKGIITVSKEIPSGDYIVPVYLRKVRFERRGSDETSVIAEAKAKIRILDETYSIEMDDLVGLKDDSDSNICVQVPSPVVKDAKEDVVNKKLKFLPDEVLKDYIISLDESGNIVLENGMLKLDKDIPFGTYSMTIQLEEDASFSKEISFKITKKPQPPLASPNGGTFRSSTKVTLTTSQKSYIHYTLDGSNPTCESPVYEEPITITRTTVLKAVAIARDVRSDVLTVKFTKKKSSSSGSGSLSSNSTDKATEDSSTKVTDVSDKVDGVANDSKFTVGTKNTTYTDGTKNISVVTENSAIKNEVSKMDEGEKITVPVKGQADLSKGIFSVQSIKDMQEKDLVLEVETDAATYELQTDLIDVNAISKEIGKDISLSDIEFSVEISKTNDEMAEVVKHATKKDELTIVVPPMDFQIHANYNEKSYEVNKFDAFVTRRIEILSKEDANKITTAIITEPDGSIRHIPTYVTEVEGKYYATINSLTNSTYTLINNEVTFSDVPESHWAKADIEKMASRLVVGGNEDGTFSPNETITRAELAEILVKALGLNPKESKNFTDVESGSKYAGYIGTAYNYGIISGTSQTTFNPERLVTRQDAMTMIYRTAKITEFNQIDNGKSITQYEDYKNIAGYAKDATLWNVNHGIISGKSETKIAPYDYITRAEMAAVTNRFLKLSGLIN